MGEEGEEKLTGLDSLQTPKPERNYQMVGHRHTLLSCKKKPMFICMFVFEHVEYKNIHSTSKVRTFLTCFKSLVQG